MRATQQKLIHAVEARKTQGICVELPGVQLLEREGDLLASSRRDGDVGLASDCTEECRKLPGCKQVAFAGRGCVLSGAFSGAVADLGDGLRSAYCGELRETSRMKELRDRMQQDVRMRKAQGICLDVKRLRLAGGRLLPSGPQDAKECVERCRVLPRCAQAVFSEEGRSCYHSMNASAVVAVLGGTYHSAYCGNLETTMDMKDMQGAVELAVAARESSGTCVKLEAVALRGRPGDLLAELPGLGSATACLARCRTAPGCRQAAFAHGGGCRLFGRASAAVAHVGSAYTSAYCGGPTRQARLRRLRRRVREAVQMRRAMAVCEEMPGLQLADGRGGGSLAAFAPGTNATAARCVERCRREPGCSQAIFSSGNGGCYLFRAAALRAVHASPIYHSAYCGEVKEARRIAENKRKALQQVQMRQATGICKEIPGIQIADGSGHHEALFSNQTATPAKCINTCRKQLGCEQAVFSEGNKGCYLFEISSHIKAVHEGQIFHSAYCGDLEQVKVTEARREKVKQQVKERKAHGLCFDAWGIRTKEGLSGTLAEFPGNATWKKCLERCRTELGCEQAIFFAKDSSCYMYQKAAAEVFHGLWERPNYHVAFCGDSTDWKVHKAQQVKVQRAVYDRKKSGACVDLPGVRLYDPKGTSFYAWAENASQCVENCRVQPFCGQIAYDEGRCRLFQNYTVDFSALGKTYFSARCSDWKDFAALKVMQKKTLALMKAKTRRP